MEKLHQELQHSRDELSRRINMATDTADAMLHNAAGGWRVVGEEGPWGRGRMGI
jgi:hypothetical protein